MENIAQKINALDYSEEMKAILPKFLATLVARDPETGKEIVTVEEIVQTIKYLKEKGISLRPSQIKVLANGFSYIQKAVEEVEKIGELKIYIDDPTRITSDETVQRIKYLRDHKIEYKSAEGKYSKLAYSKRAFEAEFGAIDFTMQKTVEAPKPTPEAKQTTKAETPAAPKTTEGPKLAPETKEPVGPKAPTEPKKAPEAPKAPVEPKTPEATKIAPKDKPQVEPKKVETKPEPKMEINPEPRKDAPKFENGKIEPKAPVLTEAPAEKLNLGEETPKKPAAPVTDKKPEGAKAPEANKPAEPKKTDSNAPKDIKPVTPVKPGELAKNAPKVEANKPKDDEEKVPTRLNKDESIEYTGELDLASLEASFNDHKEDKKEDTLVKNTTVELASPQEDKVYTPYDEILNKPQTIALTDETFERYERLSDSIRRVLTTVYNMTEITDNITDNLIKLITAGVPSDAEVMFYAITYGKNISEEETQHLRSSIEEELEYIKIFDINPDGQGRAA